MLLRDFYREINRMREDYHVAIPMWISDDILDRARERNIDLTLGDANNILDLLHDNHDAGIGITWEVVDITTNLYLDAKKKNGG